MSSTCKNGKVFLTLLIILCLFFISNMTGCEKLDSSGTNQAYPGGFHAQVIKHTDKLYDVSAPGGENVWVVGYFGSLFYSKDNGLHWSRKDAGVKESLLGIHFLGGSSWVNRHLSQPPEMAPPLQE